MTPIFCFRPRAGLAVTMIMLLGACAAPESGEAPEPLPSGTGGTPRELTLVCDDGKRLEVRADGFSAAVTDNRGRRVLHRLADAPGEAYTNGWFTVMLEDGKARYATGRTAFTQCRIER